MRARHASLFFLGLVSVGLGVAACGGGTSVTPDDSLSGVNTGGTGGNAAGAGGTAGKGGATGGAGGTAGGAGGAGGAKAGAGGTPNGGSAGASGSTAGGKAGAAGVGGSAGASGGSAGSGGMLMCGTTQLDCDKQPTNGCETTITTDEDNCGGCGIKCPSGKNSGPKCKAQLCFLECLTGFADCNKMDADGCEVSTTNDLNNCGTCGVKCGTGANGSPQCFNGNCGFTCTAPFGDCNGIAADGCEANLNNDPKNCGVCAKKCDGGGQCVNGACACAGSSVQAELLPLDMYVMFDNSGSMAGQRWDSATAAMKSFVQSPGSNGMGVGIDFFPYEDGCSAGGYANPKVAIAKLPGNAAALVNAINAANPDGSNTPTMPAVEGARDYARSFKNANPTHKVIVVLVTDGQPNGCGSSVGSVSNAAMDAFSGNPSIPVYVVGVGTSLANLDQVAAAGGTGKAIIVNSGDSAQLIQAMKDIQGKSIGCEYKVPAPPPGQQFDPTKVNVKYTGTGKPPTIISNVSGAGACGANGGWYYDVPAAPTKIILCKSSCDTAQADVNAKVEIEIGCGTQKD